MLIKILQSLFERDLNKLKADSAGNLCLHLVGNLNAFIGAELGETGYVRQRDLEFSLKDVPRKELLQKIEATAEVVKQSLSTVTQEQLEADYPVMIFKEKLSTGMFLTHLVTHLNYHLGQINYHRRLLDA
jgi:uncharacterized damage-inducible protein DinB